MFPHHEFKFYSFGLRAGLSNLRNNGTRLGVKKTLGKITQPINAYSRFPEYCWFDSAISNFLNSAPRQKLKILDVGSPKMLGLYLAQKKQIKIMLTDISEINVDEYEVMWKALEERARGEASFSLQDARALQYQDAEFDIVYSMSVIEHIEGADGDARAIREMLRVLKPGGLLALSVPYGAHYMEQQRIGFSGAARKTGDQRTYFFQRIYDPAAIQQRILQPAAGFRDVTLTTISRTNQWLGRAFGSLSENVRGALGFVNPFLSLAINRSSKGMNDFSRVTYGEIHSARDVYGDLILTGRKP
jgi:ubiquinone/menaquinone biosynthesis C-methylase UbiE